ncbi:MAG: response regulator transcription factor [Sulfurimonas sp.]|jgi:DNA-binding response OmpR family regulator|uniref:response regulator transcription factor n=1 Tax=Sulfurimonas sp. TaxID=2022749 RepID=UPI00260CA1BB|nr:response regulator transcription factor [Sulfurimonas sp.]MDD3344698.1 response regulator transcription factor [Sulfurospirillaceae bacterium]MDD3475601.1 response regulator transcription factor [Sulfurimonas sp.]HUH41907.1 response regulator transcription factor [Sulfurimonas sp.]
MKVEKIRDISILLAEDESELRELLHEYLQLFFSRIYTAASGDEAYDIYLQKRPKIILTDLSMPKLDGLKMISKIRENDKETKIIVMSAHSEQEKLLLAIKLHLEAYLIKPIKTENLKTILFDIVKQIKEESHRTYVEENIYWDHDTSTLWRDSREIKLRKMESMLLRLLFSKPNEIFSTKEIFDYLHTEKDDKEFSVHAVTSLMKRLRAKLPDEVIHNIYGSGYKVIPI